MPVCQLSNSVLVSLSNTNHIQLRLVLKVTQPPELYHHTLQAYMLLEATLHLTPCVNTYLLIFLPQRYRRQSHNQISADSTVNCHSTFTHFALIQSSSSIQFGNCCGVSSHQNDILRAEMHYFVSSKIYSSKQFGGSTDRPGLGFITLWTFTSRKQMNQLEFVY